MFNSIGINKFIVNKNKKIKIERHPSLTPGAELKASHTNSIKALIPIVRINIQQKLESRLNEVCDKLLSLFFGFTNLLCGTFQAILVATDLRMSTPNFQR